MVYRTPRVFKAFAGFKMKQALLVVVAVLAGMVLGGWGPRSDLRRAREEIEDLKRRGARGWTQGGEIQGVRQMLRLADDGTVRTRAAERARGKPAAPRSGSGGGVAAAPAATQAVARAASPTNDGAEAIWEGADIEEAAKFWNARAALARNSLVSNLKLDAARAEQFDTLVAAMNLRLETGISNWVQGVKARGEVTTEDGVRLMSELSSAVVLTYNELDRAMPSGWRKAAGDKFEVINFVDPAVAMPLMEVEGFMRGLGEGDMEGDGGTGGSGGISISIGGSSDSQPPAAERKP